MQFSSGDVIALIVGSIGALRWIVDKFFDKSEEDNDRFNALQLDYERFKAARAEIDKATVSSLHRLERGLQELQSQIRLAVSGGGNKFIEVTSDDKNGTR